MATKLRREIDGHDLCLLLFLTAIIITVKTLIAETMHIVHLEEREEGFLGYNERITWYSSFLPDETSLIYSYQNAITGFAARVSEEEIQEMQGADGFLQAYPDAVVQLQTTYSPQFLGLDPLKNGGLWQKSGQGEGIIIGALDGGLWPESPSFHDNGIPAPPARWKGFCQNGTKFIPSKCNNKGTNASSTEYGNSARDSYGHGTHTSSTAAGNNVIDANFLGVANGTAR
ncbi:hypothetical protein KI387_026260, partial [Taxus chinensis]